MSSFFAFAALRSQKFYFSWLQSTSSGSLTVLSQFRSIFSASFTCSSFLLDTSCSLFGMTFLRLLLIVLSLPLIFSLRLSQNPVFHTLMTLSEPPETKQSPCLLNLVVLEWDYRVYQSLPFWLFQILVVPSSEELMRQGQWGWKSMLFTGPSWPSQIWMTCCERKSQSLIFLSWEQEAMQLPREWNLTWWMTPVCSWQVWMDFFVFRSQMWMSLSSQETRLVAVGENQQQRTQLLCCFKVYCSLRSTVDQILTSLSSPHDESSSPSHEKPTALILAL